jgi:hypothetical protein
MALEQIARPSGEARRQVIDRFVRSARSSPPESGHPTQRPAPSAAAVTAAMSAPRAPRVASIASDETRRFHGFGEHEAPTRPGSEQETTLPAERTKTRLGIPAQVAQQLAPAPAPQPSSAPADDQSPRPAGGGALRPAAIVAIEPASNLTTQPAEPGAERQPPDAPDDAAMLRAAFAAARQAGLGPPSEIPVPMPPADLASLVPTRAPPPLHSQRTEGLVPSNALRKQRARVLALAIAVIILLMALLAIVRALSGESPGAESP